MRSRHRMSRRSWAVAGALSLIMVWPASAVAQQVEITPKTSITPSSATTSWVYQIALAAGAMAVLVVIGIALAYLRFAPKFFGREERVSAVPPGTRPAALTRQAASIRWTPPATPAPGHASPAPPSPAAPAGRQTATAVAERPPPAPQPTAETAAPEAPAEPAAPAQAAPAPEPAQDVQAAAAPAAKPAAPPAPAPAPAASHGAALDQETFDRVLEEQLAKGVDRRVAEGRARAAAVVAARKKTQG